MRLTRLSHQNKLGTKTLTVVLATVILSMIAPQVSASDTSTPTLNPTPNPHFMPAGLHSPKFNRNGLVYPKEPVELWLFAERHLFSKRFFRVYIPSDLFDIENYYNYDRARNLAIVDQQSQSVSPNIARPITQKPRFHHLGACAQDKTCPYNNATKFDKWLFFFDFEILDQSQLDNISFYVKGLIAKKPVRDVPIYYEMLDTLPDYRSETSPNAVYLERLVNLTAFDSINPEPQTGVYIKTLTPETFRIGWDNLKIYQENLEGYRVDYVARDLDPNNVRPDINIDAIGQHTTTTTTSVDVKLLEDKLYLIQIRPIQEGFYPKSGMWYQFEVRPNTVPGTIIGLEPVARFREANDYMRPTGFYPQPTIPQNADTQILDQVRKQLDSVQSNQQEITNKANQTTEKISQVEERLGIVERILKKLTSIINSLFGKEKPE